MPSGLSQSPACRFLKFQAWSPAGCKSSRKSVPLPFKDKCYGNLSSPFMGSLVQKSVFQPSPHYCLPPHHRWPESVLRPDPHLHPSYLFQCGPCSAFSCGACSSSLLAFLGYLYILLFRDNIIVFRNNPKEDKWISKISTRMLDIKATYQKINLGFLCQLKSLNVYEYIILKDVL